MLNFQAELMSYLTLVQHRPFLICLGVKTPFLHIRAKLLLKKGAKKYKSAEYIRSMIFTLMSLIKAKNIKACELIASGELYK